MTTATPPRQRSRPSLLGFPPVREVRAPAWFDRLPRWLSTVGVLLALMAISAVLRSRTLSGQLWFGEASATGLASNSLSALPGALRAAGASPLYYLLLHFWIDIFGSGESATRVLSLLIALMTIPIAMWTGWSIGGRRAGFFAAVLFAFSSFLTRYAQETQPAALMTLLGLLATAGFVHGFIYRRRGFLWLFAAPLALMLYTEGAALVYWFGAGVALAPVAWAADDRRGLARDAALCFAGAAVIYVPWLPTSLHQIANDTSPWHYAPLIGATVSSQLLGSERVDVTLLVAVIIGIGPLVAAGRRRSPEAVVIWSVIVIAAAGLLLARILGFFVPVWAWRYFAPIVAPLLLLCAFASARARLVGVAAIALCVVFLADPGAFAPSYKSDMRDVAAEMAPLLHPGDLVVVGQPEQTPLAWYYLPNGLRFADTIGPVDNPTYMNWTDALGHLRAAAPRATLDPLVASLKPGQQLLYVRPLTEGVANWKEPWARLVRRRSAQWGAILAGDAADGTLEPVAWAPHSYRSACCEANSATLYRKAS